jgi:uncharacterized protein (DUF305 family)
MADRSMYAKFGVMTAPMVVIELIVMRAMYPGRHMNRVLIGLATAVGIATFAGIRWQVGVGDRQMMRAMIPHHSGAVLACTQSNLEDPDVRALCQRIVESQRREIAEMNALLAR